MSVAHNVKRYVMPTNSDSNVRVISFGSSANVVVDDGTPNRRRPYTPLIRSMYNETTPSTTTKRGSDNSDTVEAIDNQLIRKEISKESLQIYLIQSEANLTAQTTWGTLAKQWNRTAQYEDLLQLATPISTLPSLDTTTTSIQHSTRPIIMIHCGPKTGSTTLRTACKHNLEKTCGIPRRTNGHYPEGYMDKNKLFPLIRKCTNTSHFCAKEIAMPTDIPTYNHAMFIHMFPFRNYDEWARSALKQQYDRGRENGCKKTEALLEECKHSRMEIDFRKYGKTELSKFKEGVVQRMNEREGEQHIFLLYHHRELNEVLSKLSDLYSIPLLPGSDGKGKETRPEGTCDDRLLEMYHDCFSSQLMELT